jgi:glucose-1-phosphate thymidylyltransferase
MKGLILSGGKGTRLQPLTYTRAKQLVPVANKPVLFHVIECLLEANVQDIGIVVGGHTAQEITEVVGAARQRYNWQADITFIHQPSPDGLAHAVKIAEPFLKDDSFALFLGDNVIQGGISSLISDFEKNDWNSQIVLKEVANPRSYGVATLRADGSIERLVEKPENPPSNYALIGVYMFDANIFKAVHAIQPSKRGELEITDAIQWLIEHGYRVFPHMHSGWWIDTGKPIDMLDANSHVLEELTPTIAPDVIIENSEIDSRVTIQSGAKIINSTIHGPAIVGENCVIENSYLGPFTSIYHNTHIRNCEIVRSIVLEHSTLTDIHTIIRDSLIGRKVTLQSNTQRPHGLKLNLGDNSHISL